MIPSLLLIDGRNLIYRAVCASRRPGGTADPGLVIFLKQLASWASRFKASGVVAFWDDYRDRLWRRKVFAGYKLRDDLQPDTKAAIDQTQSIAREMLTHLGIRQLFRTGMEADDLIYSACKVLAPQRAIVCSSDGDYVQIAFRMQHVSVFSPHHDKLLVIPDFDPVVMKALAGDNSDTIPGYQGIGPKNGERLAKDIVARVATISEKGISTYIRNTLLVDLSLCPDALKNELYVQRALATEVKFDKEAALALAKQHKLTSLLVNSGSMLVPFKMMVEHQNAS